ncbi:hypothetical protein C8R44DRAFT_855324 [Mycena epipterygia]|nr:hypothetical protein C8R44DRAFT_855324 [Mycena epipterygia]
MARRASSSQGERQGGCANNVVPTNSDTQGESSPASKVVISSCETRVMREKENGASHLAVLRTEVREREEEMCVRAKAAGKSGSEGDGTRARPNPYAKATEDGLGIHVPSLMVSARGCKLKAAKGNTITVWVSPTVHSGQQGFVRMAQTSNTSLIPAEIISHISQLGIAPPNSFALYIDLVSETLAGKAKRPERKREKTGTGGWGKNREDACEEKLFGGLKTSASTVQGEVCDRWQCRLDSSSNLHKEVEAHLISSITTLPSTQPGSQARQPELAISLMPQPADICRHLPDLGSNLPESAALCRRTENNPYSRLKASKSVARIAIDAPEAHCARADISSAPQNHYPLPNWMSASAPHPVRHIYTVRMGAAETHAASTTNGLTPPYQLCVDDIGVSFLELLHVCYYCNNQLLYTPKYRPTVHLHHRISISDRRTLLPLNRDAVGPFVVHDML